MKAIINGFRYDTEKATAVGGANNIGAGASFWSDFSAWEATLYKTPRAGRYFLAGEGGPMTRFSHRVDQNSTSGGSKIIPMTAEEALEWAENYLDADAVEKHFSDMIKDA